jgi:hypothetical protein
MKTLINFSIIALFALTISCNQTQNQFQPEPTGVDKFLENLKVHCGNSYEGVVTEGAREGDAFFGQRLTMQVLSCEENRVRIPFHVGENLSRTWIITKEPCGKLKLKHDHRLPDGTDDPVTMYGGLATTTGTENLQIFPADQETFDLLDYTVANVWWITIDENHFTYNLRRVNTDRLFTVTFDLKKPIEKQPDPWGWKE